MRHVSRANLVLGVPATARFCCRSFCVPLVAFLLGFSFCAAAPSEEGDEPTRHVFRLKYKEVDFSLQVDTPVEGNEVFFGREPKFSGRDIVRGPLRRFRQADMEFIGFAWDSSAGKLYLDLNRNLDLTDDPDGIFESKDGWFRDVRFDIERGSMRIPCMIDLAIRRTSGGWVSCEAFVRSVWQAEIELNGKKWWFAVQDNMDGEIDLRDCVVFRSSEESLTSVLTDGQIDLRDYLVFRSSEESLTSVLNEVRANLAQIRASEILEAPDSLPLMQRLSFDGASYDLELGFEYAEAGTELVATFTESDIPFGELRIDGKSIKRLVLQRQDEKGVSFVVLDAPEANVKVPVGSYLSPTVFLDGGGSTGLFSASSPKGVLITEDKPAILKVGGPLTHRLTVNPRGNQLQLLLSYKLLGAGGESYVPCERARERPPQLAIYKGDTKIASGSFEYG